VRYITCKGDNWEISKAALTGEQSQVNNRRVYMKILNCMKKTVYSISVTATMRDAIRLLVTHHIGLLPVVDHDQKLVGVVGLYDMLNLALPSTMQMLNDVDFIGDFGAVETYHPSDKLLDQPITNIMRPGTVVQADSGLIRAYAFMLQHDLHDLPVVDADGRLIGIASRVDIGVNILTGWQ
jgi:CBS domain-containing membrane protein